MKRISLVLFVCFFFGLGSFALAQENSPHFFGKNVRPEAFFQKTEPMEFHLYFYDNDPETMFEKIEKSVKRLLGRKLEFSFFLNKRLVEKFYFFNGLERVELEIRLVFKDENK